MRKRILLAPLVGIPLLLTGCVPGAGGGQTDAHDQPAGHVLTAEDVRGLGDVTLRMTDFGTESGTNAAFKEIIDSFESEFPNVTIDREAKEFSSYSDTLGLVMSSDDAPDIAQSNVVLARTLVEAGLITPLDDYYSGYDWGETIPAGSAQLLKLSADGKNLGEGSYWGIGPGGNMVVVYYNKQLLKQLGRDVPQTFEEFTQTMDAAASAGILPIQLGNLEQFYAGHLFFAVNDALATQADTIAWLSGAEGATFATDANVQTATLLQDWSEGGYIPRDANGIRSEDARASFIQGEGLFLVGTTYVMDQINNQMGENGGAFVLPPSDGVDSAQATGWLADPFTISSASESRDLAAFFLDYMNKPEFSASLIDGGIFPFAGDYSAPAESVVTNEVLGLWREQLQTDSLVPYLDFATPSMGTVLFPELQSLLGGQSSPASFAEKIQQDWADYYGG